MKARLVSRFNEAELLDKTRHLEAALEMVTGERDTYVHALQTNNDLSQQLARAEVQLNLKDAAIRDLEMAAGPRTSNTVLVFLSSGRRIANFLFCQSGHT